MQRYARCFLRQDPQKRKGVVMGMDWTGCCRCKPFLAVVLLVFSVVAHAAGQWRTPQPGEPERAQIMDALRAKLAQQGLAGGPQEPKTVFVVREFCISSAKGWVTVDPRSADGSWRGETFSASLKRHKQRWVVDKLACGEEECPPGTDAEALRRRVGPRCP